MRPVYIQAFKHSPIHTKQDEQHQIHTLQSPIFRLVEIIYFAIISFFIHHHVCVCVCACSLLECACVDAELFGVYVPRPGSGEGIQHEPHHSQTLAGTVDIVA